MIPKTPSGTIRRAPKGTLKSLHQLALEKLEEKINAVKIIEGPMGPSGKDGSTPQIDALMVAELLKRDPLFKEELKGEKGEKGEDAQKQLGGGGAPKQFRYNKVRTATYIIKASSLVQGMNIFGVDYDGDVTITLPNNITSDRLIVVNDESGNAGANNITVQTN